MKNILIGLIFIPSVIFDEAHYAGVASLENDSSGKLSHTMACEDYVLQFSDDINKATQEGDDEKALQLAAFVFNYFSEQGVLNKVRYGNLDADDAIVFSAHIPSSFPIKIEKNSDEETISYTVDLTSVKNIISQNGIYEYIVIISPWTGNTLFKIKISEDLLFLWTRE